MITSFLIKLVRYFINSGIFVLASSLFNLVLNTLKMHYYKIMISLTLNRNLIKAFCVLAYLSPQSNIENLDTYWIVVLQGDCSQYTLTSEFLMELSKHAVRMEDINWPILAQDNTLNYVIIKPKQWKDTFIFEIIEQGNWKDWVKEVIEANDSISSDTSNNKEEDS